MRTLMFFSLIPVFLFSNKIITVNNLSQIKILKYFSQHTKKIIYIPNGLPSYDTQFVRDNSLLSSLYKSFDIKVKQNIMGNNTTITNNNITTNNITDNSIKVNGDINFSGDIIIVNPFEISSMDHVDHKLIINCIRNVLKYLPDLINDVYLNKNHPENFNIGLRSAKNMLFQFFTSDGIIVKGKESGIRKIVYDILYILDDHIGNLFENNNYLNEKYGELLPKFEEDCKKLEIFVDDHVKNMTNNTEYRNCVNILKEYFLTNKFIND